MIKKLFITLFSLVILVGLPAFIKVRQFQLMGATPMVIPPETVTSAIVQKETWPETIQSIGSLVAVQGVNVSTEIGGKVVEITFTSGDHVEKGEVLVRLDTSTEQAQLNSAKAAATLARIDLDRNRDLLKKKTIAQSQYDTAEANFRQATAQVDSVRSMIEKKTLRAPFSGQLGLRLVNLGQILEPGNSIVILQTMDPIYVEFMVPQQYLPLLNPGTEVKVTTDAAPGEQFVGTINAINSEIDIMTRNIQVQASISNDKKLLRPGMYASVAVVLSHPEEVIAIPATAVLYAPYGDTVFVIDQEKNKESGKVQNILRQQIVRLGRAQGDFVAVLSGLKAGDLVVSSGVFKLRPKMAVVVDNTYAPEAKLNPTPRNE